MNQMFFKRRKKKNVLSELKLNFGKRKDVYRPFDLIKRYYSRKDHSKVNQQITEQTKTDLDLDVFFEHIDHTNCPIGQQTLYNSISSITHEPKQFENQEKLIEYFNSHPDERLNVQYELTKLNNNDSYYICDLFQEQQADNPKWFFVVPLLSFTSLLSLILGFFNPYLFGVLLVTLPLNVIIHFYNKSAVNLYIRAVPQLLVMNKVAKNVLKNSFLSKLFAQQKKSVNTLNAIKKRVGIFKLEQKVDTDLEITYWFLLEVVKIIFLLEPLLLYSVLNKLNKEHSAIEAVYKFIGVLDTSIAIHSLRSGEADYCIPNFTAQNTGVSFTNLRHPLIDKCVPNTLDGAAKHYLITGSNMSGKSTFMRTIGLNCLSAMTLNTCFASSLTMPYLKIHTVMRISDSLQESSSYFLKEVKAIKTVLDESEKEQSNLILIDEIFKGTNTRERIAAAKSILTYLCKANNFVVASSHDLELTDLLKKHYALYYFSEQVQHTEISFDYQLKKGKPEIGNALRILKLNDYPNAILTESAGLVFNSEC